MPVKKALKGCRAILAGTLAAFVFGVPALAYNQVYHEHIHNDAGQPGHQCAITLFATGQVEFTDVPCLVCAPSIFSELLSLPAGAEIPETIVAQGYSARAPPAGYHS